MRELERFLSRLDDASGIAGTLPAPGAAGAGSTQRLLLSRGATGSSKRPTPLPASLEIPSPKESLSPCEVGTLAGDQLQATAPRVPVSFELRRTSSIEGVARQNLDGK